MLVSNLLFLGLISLLLASCSTLPSTLPSSLPSSLPSRFTAENIMKVYQGMSSDEILTLFGEPKSISVNVCGVAPNQWTCTTWEYGEFPYDSASFTFSGTHDSLKLNNFEVDRD
jgi:hypothetical protein